MNVEIQPFKLDGCQCRLKFDPKEVQSALDEALNKSFSKKSKKFDRHEGDLQVTGSFSEIDEGNFALHFMLAFLGKAMMAGQMQVTHNGNVLLQEPFRLNKTFAAFTNGKGQLKGNAKFLADDIVKKTLKALK